MSAEFVDWEREAKLVRLKIDFQIERIFYPGAGDHTELARPFGSESVFLLDAYPPLRCENLQYFKGRVEKSPFANDFFDAAYFRCLHPNEEELAGVLKVVRPEGVVILDMFRCTFLGNDLELLERSPYLKSLELPYLRDEFRVFKKGV